MELVRRVAGCCVGHRHKINQKLSIVDYLDILLLPEPDRAKQVKNLDGLDYNDILISIVMHIVMFGMTWFLSKQIVRDTVHRSILI